ncbi:MAG: hypothetical protein LAO19_15385 [Acidobacteriia bacterium]|nr:hypothetical protein [Terriglobia bacterium]
MKILLSIAAMCVFALLFSTQAQTQTAGTNLVIHANWDSKSAVDGVVTLGQMNLKGPETVIVSRNLWNGRAAFQTVLAPNAVYDVILTSSDGTQLAKFPVTTVMINPANLERAGISLVFSRADKSLKSASVNVDMNF